MERLTEWRGEHAAVVNHHVNYIDRLAAYEDTGLSPEEIGALPYRKEFAYADYMKELFPKMERAEELSAADKDRRLAVLPCKLGDTVWVLHMGFNANFLQLYQGYCVEISQSLLHGSAEESYAVDVIDFGAWYRKSDIGSTLFFSQAAAEEALKKRREE